MLLYYAGLDSHSHPPALLEKGRRCVLLLWREVVRRTHKRASGHARLSPVNSPLCVAWKSSLADKRHMTALPAHTTPFEPFARVILRKIRSEIPKTYRRCIIFHCFFNKTINNFQWKFFFAFHILGILQRKNMRSAYAQRKFAISLIILRHFI